MGAVAGQGEARCHHRTFKPGAGQRGRRTDLPAAGAVSFCDRERYLGDELAVEERPNKPATVVFCVSDTRQRVLSYPVPFN